jgi:hypothetical protein
MAPTLGPVCLYRKESAMRPAVVAGLVLAVLPAAAPAQSGPYFAVVTDPEVIVRAGPSDQFPETGTVRHDARVVVDHEESNGWLAIEAPTGSVSWVPNSFIDFDPGRPIPQLVVTSADVTLNAGRVGLAQPLLEVRRAKVPQGTPLTVIGGVVLFDGNKKWYPVAPPPGDFRYIPKAAVQPQQAVNTSFTVRTNDTVVPAGSTASPAPPALGPTAAISGPGAPAAAPPKPIVNHPLWAQAEALEKDGRLDDAEKVYFQLARLMNEPGGDHDIANLCYTRIHSLREKKRTSAPSGSASNIGTLLPPVKDDRSAARPATTVDRSPAPTVDRSPAPAADRNPPPLNPQDNRPQWAGPGVLVRSALALDGRRTYALESSPGVPRLYVVPAKDVDLERYVNRRVDVFGSTYSRRELSKPYIVVTQVEPNP